MRTPVNIYLFKEAEVHAWMLSWRVFHDPTTGFTLISSPHMDIFGGHPS